MSHAIFSPSSSSRWLTCTASVNLLGGVKESKTSIFSLKGTACHEMAEAILNGDENYKNDLLTNEDIETIVQPYVSYVRDIDADIKLYEKKVFITEDCYGTADCIAFNSETKTLHVIDLKGGSGVKVYAEGNTQLQIYALGALKLFEAEHVVAHIVQPAIDNIFNVELSIVELMRLDTKIKQTIKDVKNKRVKFAASDSACRWCTKKIDCPELFMNAQNAAFNDFSDSDVLSDKMQLVAPLKHWIKAIEEESLKKLMRGEALKGFKLVRGRGSRSWKEEKIDELKNLVDEQLLYERKMLSVAKIEKLKLDIELDEYVEKKDGAPKMVESASPLKEINKLKDAKNDFEHLMLI